MDKLSPHYLYWSLDDQLGDGLQNCVEMLEKRVNKQLNYPAIESYYRLIIRLQDAIDPIRNSLHHKIKYGIKFHKY